MLAHNIPELPRCDGIEIVGVCVPWLLVGLALGTVALFLVTALRALRQGARVLDGQRDAVAFGGVPPRVSLVRLAPMPTASPRRAKQR